MEHKRTPSQRKVITRENQSPGSGQIVLDHLLAPEEIVGGRMFARATLKPSAALAAHTHRGESETYYILSGCGEYTDDGKTYPVEAGDVLVCPDGGTHGLRNTGASPLVFIALILNAE